MEGALLMLAVKVVQSTAGAQLLLDQGILDLLPQLAKWLLSPVVQVCLVHTNIVKDTHSKSMDVILLTHSPMCAVGLANLILVYPHLQLVHQHSRTCTVNTNCLDQLWVFCCANMSPQPSYHAHLAKTQQQLPTATDTAMSQR